MHETQQIPKHIKIRKICWRKNLTVFEINKSHSGIGILKFWSIEVVFGMKTSKKIQVIIEEIQK